MPYIHELAYQPAHLFRNGNFNTIYANALRGFPEPDYRRIRWDLEDGDFLDIDYLQSGENGSIVLLLHGFEGNSNTQYMMGMASILHRSGYDVAAMNMRGCSGEPNRLSRYYSGADTDDLQTVIHELTEAYNQVIPVGFSLGGNLVTKYMALDNPPSRVPFAFAISAPLHIPSSVAKIHSFRSMIYHSRFVSMLKRKMKAKLQKNPMAFPGISPAGIRTIREFDEKITAPAFGYDSVDEYYTDADITQVLEKLDRPLYVINATDDPILTEDCFPYKIASESSYFTLFETKYGGHCGFIRPGYRYTFAEVLVQQIIKAGSFQPHLIR